MFKIIHKSKKSKARIGVIFTPHGKIKTPNFLPIATRGAVKNLTPQELKKIGVEIILANTYHLFQRPGDKLIGKFGGLHRFINWPRPILTDSGGYQVFSLAKFRKITYQGVLFRSEIDGRSFLLSPEKAMEIQKNLNSDIAMVLDYCLGYPAERKKVEEAVELTTQWAKRSKEKWQKLKAPGLIFGIIQGGIFKDLRKKSLTDLLRIGFDGYAIGGLAVGEPEKEMKRVLEFLLLDLPEEKPRYLMGVGYPHQIAYAIKLGVDLFDCVIPTRHARHGELFRWKNSNLESSNFYEIIQIEKAKFSNKFQPIDKNCSCPTCQNFSLAYLHHLYRTKEMLYYRLASLHNLKFYLDFIKLIRTQIKKKKF